MTRWIARRHRYTFDDLRAVYPNGEPVRYSPRFTQTALLLTLSAVIFGVVSYTQRPLDTSRVESVRWVLYEEDGALHGRISGRWPQGGSGQRILGHWTTKWTRGHTGVTVIRAVDRATLHFGSDQLDISEPLRERIVAFMRHEMMVRFDDGHLQSFEARTQAGPPYVTAVAVGPTHGRLDGFATTLRFVTLASIATAMVGFPMLVCIGNRESHRRRYLHLESIAQAAVDARTCPACRYPRGTGDRCTECGRVWPTPNR